MRQERNNRDERERGMQSAIEERVPRQRAAEDHVRPEALHTRAAKPERHDERGGHQERSDQQMQLAGRIEDGKDHQSERVVCNREQQQKRNGGMLLAVERTPPQKSAK